MLITFPSASLTSIQGLLNALMHTEPSNELEEVLVESVASKVDRIMVPIVFPKDPPSVSCQHRSGWIDPSLC